MDTCKAANLYSTHPADFLAYVNAPVGDGRPVPGPLKPHIACPTTSGTGSEATGIAIFDLLALKAKTGIQSRWLKPTTGLIDPEVTRTLPATIVASTGFDAMSHALESITAVSYARRAKAPRPSLRPPSQGANPWSDAVAFEALRLIGQYFVRAVKDAGDRVVKWVREGNGPTILEMLTYRYRGHSMSDPAKYRTREEVQKMREEQDPIEQVRRRLLDGKLVSEDDVKAIDAEIRGIVTAAAEFAQNDPEPDESELWTDVLVPA